MRKGNVTKYIQKLREHKLPALLIGQNEGLGLKEVFHPAFDRNVKPPKRQQIAEFYGKFGENHVFYNDNYKNLVTSIKENDSVYSNSESLEERIKFCKMGITTWYNFVHEESKNMPEENSKTSSANFKLFREVFERQKERNKNYLPAEEILGFHYEYAKNKEFEFPLDPKSLAIILHPHWGYLCKFTRKNFTFEEIIEFYNYEFLSSFNRNLGRV